MERMFTNCRIYLRRCHTRDAKGRTGQADVYLDISNVWILIDMDTNEEEFIENKNQ